MLVRFVVSLGLVLSLAAQTKRPLTIADFDSWKSISGHQISADGRFVAYGLFPQVGDGEIVVKNLRTGAELRQPAGELPRPAYNPDAEEPTPPPSVTFAFTADSKFLLTHTFPTKDERKKAAKEKAKEQPKNGLIVWNLEAGTVERVADIKNFQVAKDAPVAAWLKDAKDAAELTLRLLATATTKTFPSASEYTISKDGRTLVYTEAVKDKPARLLNVTTATGDAAELLSTFKLAKPVWDEGATRLSVLGSAAKNEAFHLYLWNRDANPPADVAHSGSTGLLSGYDVSDNFAPKFSKDGKRLFFGLATKAASAAKPSGDEEKAQFDLWHWKDDNVQPMQKVRAARERKRTYTAVYHIDSTRLVQLADATMPDIQIIESAAYISGSDDRAYRPLNEWDQRYADYYLVDLRSGERKQLLTKSRSGLNWAPNGSSAVFFDGKDWISIAVPSGEQRNLTARLNAAFYDEENDKPRTAQPYAGPQWTRDSKFVILADRYDLWTINIATGEAANLTDGLGRSSKIQFRAVRLADDSDEPGLDPAKPLLLRAENLETRATGFYRDRFGVTAPPEKLMMRDAALSVPRKAKNADTLVLTESTFVKFPDLTVTDLSFKDLKRISEANPQQAGFTWGTAELVRYRNADGVELKSILYKPENFDPKKKYPLMVYIYERLTQGLHSYQPPVPLNRITSSFYASNGYLVLMPDIAYTIGYPGHSALKCVLPAVESVVKQGFVDEKAIGIQGHSWGGYQIAYMVTQTNLFRAAAPGALVANMTSAYEGIRWGSGLPRQFQYERDQSRIGGSLWEYPLRYLDNSPIFRADRVETPLLTMHNDADDAVPWQQGIEFFLALRRLNKEVYMFNYNGEPHNLRKRANQLDYTMRLQQFFDHYLKGAPRPDWMVKGIPYLESHPAPAANAASDEFEP